MDKPKVVKIEDWRKKKTQESIKRKAEQIKWAVEQKIIKECNELDW